MDKVYKLEAVQRNEVRENKRKESTKESRKERSAKRKELLKMPCCERSPTFVFVGEKHFYHQIKGVFSSFCICSV